MTLGCEEVETGLFLLLDVRVVSYAGAGMLVCRYASIVGGVGDRRNGGDEGGVEFGCSLSKTRPLS